MGTKMQLVTAQDKYERALAWFLIDVIIVAVGLAALIVVVA